MLNHMPPASLKHVKAQPERKMLDAALTILAALGIGAGVGTVVGFAGSEIVYEKIMNAIFGERERLTEKRALIEIQISDLQDELRFIEHNLARLDEAEAAANSGD